MKDAINSLVKSRRFWAAVGGLVITLGKDKLASLGIVLTDEQILGAVALIGTWIAGETLRSSSAPKVSQ